MVAFEELEPGGIMLVHDGAPSAPGRRGWLLGRLLEEAGRGGWTALTVGALLQQGEPVRRLWFQRRAEAVLGELAPLYLAEEPTSDVAASQNLTSQGRCGGPATA